MTAPPAARGSSSRHTTGKVAPPDLVGYTVSIMGARDKLLHQYVSDDALRAALIDQPLLVESASLQEILIHQENSFMGGGDFMQDTGSMPLVNIKQLAEIRVWQLSMLRELTTPMSRIFDLGGLGTSSAASVLVGRAPDNEVVIKDNAVSKLHARIDVSVRGAVTLTDLASSNGTRVNKRPVEPNQPVVLSYGDCLTFGRAVHYLVPAPMLADLAGELKRKDVKTARG